MRAWALVAIVVLLAAQAHVCLDAAQPRPSGHFCLLCHSGAWAIVSAHPVLELSFHIVGFKAEPPRLGAKDNRAAASSPRAPPQA
jgi:hypothetical protein